MDRKRSGGGGAKCAGVSLRRGVGAVNFSYLLILW